MLRCNVCLLIIILLGALFTRGTVAAQDEKLIPVVVVGKVEPAVVMQRQPIPSAVTIVNGLKGAIGYVAYTLKPNDWNGETANLTLVDIYRDGQPASLFLARPKVVVPTKVAGIAAYPIKSGGSLTVTTDARKWTISGGWVPGKYEANVRIETLTVEGNRCILSVHSEPFEFEIR